MVRTDEQRLKEAEAKAAKLRAKIEHRVRMKTDATYSKLIRAAKLIESTREEVDSDAVAKVDAILTAVANLARGLSAKGAPQE